MFKNLDDLREAIETYVTCDLSAETFVDWYNCYIEDEIRSMDDFDDILCNVSPRGMVEMCNDYDIDLCDEYFIYNDLDGICTKTGSDPVDMVSYEYLVDFIMDNLNYDWEEVINRMVDEYESNNKRNEEIEDIKRQLAVLQQRLAELEKEEEEE